MPITLSGTLCIIRLFLGVNEAMANQSEYLLQQNTIKSIGLHYT